MPFLRKILVPITFTGLGGGPHLSQLDCYYGSGAFGRKFREDIAAAPASPSPSKGVIGPVSGGVKQKSSAAGSANQKTMWSSSLRTRPRVVSTALENASSMIAFTCTAPLPYLLVVKSAIY